MSHEQYSRRAWLRIGAATIAVLALAACGQAAPTTSAVGLTATNGAVQTSSAASSAPSTASSSALAVTTMATTTTAASTVATSTTAAISTIAPASSARSSALAASVSTAAAAKASAVKLTLDSSGTQASYQVQEQLAGHNFPSDAIGRTSAVTGSILLDAGGKIVSGQSSLEIDLRTLKSDQGMRDSYIQHDPLDTAQYPMAKFVPTSTSGVPWPLPSSGTAKFTLTGDFTVHGTTKSTTWAVSATFAPDTVTGTAATPFLFTDFGMQPPRTMIALSVQNNGVLNLQFAAKRTAS
jgi:polyisoprenoid-binding protein YceI